MHTLQSQTRRQAELLRAVHAVSWWLCDFGVVQPILLDMLEGKLLAVQKDANLWWWFCDIFQAFLLFLGIRAAQPSRREIGTDDQKDFELASKVWCF